jgi:voltage-gated potassium channel
MSIFPRKTIRKRCFEILSIAKKNDTASKVFDIFIMSLIVVNVLVCVFGTINSLERANKNFFYYFELISVLIFSIEYILRIWSCVENKKYSSPVRGRLKYIFSPMAFIDLLAILPFYISIGGINLIGLRVLRLFRILRLVKVGRYYSSLTIIKNVFREKKEELVLTTVILVFLLFMSSSLMYYAENQAQPEAFSSIPQAMWWAVITLTTVGYGDVYPITTLGKIIGAIIAIIGIGMFALPTGIIGAGFVEEIEKKKKREKKSKFCPHCGKEVD